MKFNQVKGIDPVAAELGQRRMVHQPFIKIKYLIAKENLRATIENKEDSYLPAAEFEEPLFFHILKNEILKVFDGDESKAEETISNALSNLKSGAIVHYRQMKFQIKQ